MDSTATLSPPTSWVRAAMSVVEVMTLTFFAAAPTGKARFQNTKPNIVSTVKKKNGLLLFMSLLERMRSVGAQRKHHLQQQLISIDITRIARKAVLATYLAEFARPVGEHCGCSRVGEVGELAATGAIEASTHKPAATQLIISRCVETESALFGRKLLPLTPYKLTSPNKGMVNGAPQRLPAQSSIDAIQLSQEIAAHIIVAARVGES